MKMIYQVEDRPGISKTVVFAIQQLLAIMAATLVVPIIVGNGMSPAAALFGAGVGTLVYLLFTKFRSPVFLGSSFAFLSSMATAFAGGVSMALGYLGLIIGAILAGLVYVVIAIVVKFAGTEWINKLMPAVVIGPTVAIIGLSLAGNAIGDLQKGDVFKQIVETIKYTAGPIEDVAQARRVAVGDQDLPESLVRDEADQLLDASCIEFVEEIVEEQNGFFAGRLGQEGILRQFQRDEEGLLLSLRAIFSQRIAANLQHQIIAVDTCRCKFIDQVLLARLLQYLLKGAVVELRFVVQLHLLAILRKESVVVGNERL